MKKQEKKVSDEVEKLQEKKVSDEVEKLLAKRRNYLNFRNAVNREVYANRMADYDERFQAIVQDIRNVFVDYYRKQYNQKRSSY